MKISLSISRQIVQKSGSSFMATVRYVVKKFLCGNKEEIVSPPVGGEEEEAAKAKPRRFAKEKSSSRFIETSLLYALESSICSIPRIL